MTAKLHIQIVDDDDAVRDSLRLLLESAGFAVRDFSSARKFLDSEPASQGCLLADIRMPQMDGLELQEEIVRRGLSLPVVIMTGHGDVPLAVRAMKAGAVDFIEKPFDEERLLAAVRRALEIGESQRNQEAMLKSARDQLRLLTPREVEVLDQIVVGRSNKVAAYELGISPRTIEIHRAHIMDKLRAKSLSDLVRMVIAAGHETKN